MPAAAILSAKLALEAELRRPLFRVTAQYLSAIHDARRPLTPFERLDHASAIEAVLLRHYARVVLVFRGVVPPRDARIDQAALSIAHGERLRRQARRSAALLIRSVDRMLMVPKAVPPKHGHKSRDGLIETKAEPAPKKITAGYITSLRTLFKKLKTRINGAANVNTQSVAEEARIEIVEQEHRTGVIVQEWRCMLDGRERDDHREAHGQQTSVSGHFTVGGEHLRFPGDMELGASLKNVINCRCWAEYVVTKPDGSTVKIDRTPAVPVKTTESSKLNPTGMVTLNGKSRGQVVLGNGQIASFAQDGDRIRISVGRKQVATASWSRDPASGTVSVTGLIIVPKYLDAGIATLIHNSVGGTYGPRDGLKLTPPRLMDTDLFEFWRRRDAGAVAGDIRNQRSAIERYATRTFGPNAMVHFDATGDDIRVIRPGLPDQTVPRRSLEGLGLVKPRE
jgi:hypothetical protein